MISNILTFKINMASAFCLCPSKSKRLVEEQQEVTLVFSEVATEASGLQDALSTGVAWVSG